MHRMNKFGTKCLSLQIDDHDILREIDLQCVNDATVWTERGLYFSSWVQLTNDVCIIMCMLEVVELKPVPDIKGVMKAACGLHTIVMQPA
jgi:hypothetical protein